MNCRRIVFLLVLALAACDDPFVPEGTRAYQSLATGGEHTCAVAEDGAAYCWGRGLDGELGIGVKENRQTPTRVAGNLVFKQITAGENHTCAITPDGTAYCWGWNAYFQRGNPNDPRDAEPVLVSTNEHFRSISAGAHHTCALSLDSLAFCWGFNRYGQLGDGTLSTIVAPRAVSGGIKFVQLGSGAWHTCGVTPARRIYCWGNNEFGQLGTGASGVASGVPALINTNFPFKQVDGGRNHTCAVDIEGRTFCWGSDEYGELGNGSVYKPGLPAAFVPSRVSPLFPVGTSISAGEGVTCATGELGDGACWGRGVHGQIGNGATTDQYQPQTVNLFSPKRGLPISAFAAGGTTHVCALSDKAVYCWGTGLSGQLGKRGVRFAALPQRVPD